MSEVKVNKVSPRSGTTLTIGDSGDTVNVVGTLQNNGGALPGVTFKEGGTDFSASLLVGADSTGTLSAASRNTGVGTQVFGALTSGDNNTALGYLALVSNTSAANNTAVGCCALATTTTGARNTAVVLVL